MQTTKQMPTQSAHARLAAMTYERPIFSEIDALGLAGQQPYKAARELAVSGCIAISNQLFYLRKGESVDPDHPDEGAEHGHLDHLEARQAAGRICQQVQISPETITALAPFTQTATASMRGSEELTWSGVAPVRAFSRACTEVRLVAAASQGGKTRDVLKHYPSTAIPEALTRVMCSFMAEAIPATANGAERQEEARTYLTTCTGYANTFVLPALLRAHEALQSPAGQRQELMMMSKHGGGHLWSAVSGVGLVLSAICCATPEYAPHSNPLAAMLLPQIEAECRSVAHALGDLFYGRRAPALD